MRSTVFMLMALLCFGPSLSEGSQTTWTPPSTDSDFQGSSSGTSLADRNGSLINYTKGQSYSNTPSMSYPSTGGSYYKNYNYNYIPSVLRPTTSYYSNQRGDKSYYRGNAGFGETGRAYDTYMPPGGYTYTSRFSKAYQDPLRSRYGSFNVPQTHRSTYVYGGSFQKGSSGYSYPAHIGQAYRGSRVYGEPNRAQFEIPTRTKSRGVYIIPTPSKLYYDGKQN